MNRLSGLLTRIGRFIASLSSGERLIAYVLIGAFLVSVAVALVALERSFMTLVPAHGGSLTEGEVGSPRFVNPLFAVTDADRDLATLTYAGLMGNGKDGLVPVLAESYSVSDDGKEYTFVLREQARWSDGTPVTAQDVVFTIRKAVDPKLKSPELADWANVRVEAVGAKTVKFTLPKAYAPFLANTTLGILPEHIWKDIPDEQFPFATYMTEPVGAGPFVVDSAKFDSTGAITRYTLKANPDYVLGKPYLNSITFVFYGSVDELTHAYESGAVESAYGIPVAGAMRSPYSRVFAIFLNPAENKALGEDAVRHALSVAIDRGHITETILGGFAEARTAPLPAGEEAPEQLSSGDRIQQAKNILAEAGWVYQEDVGVWKNAKKKLTLEEITIKTSNVPELKALTDEIVKNWQAIGVKSTIEYYDPDMFSSEVIRPRNYEALYFGLVIGRENDLYPFFDSGEKTGAGLNIALYSSKQVDTLLEKARVEQDSEVRAQEIQKASELIAGDYAAIFTHTPYFLYAVPNDLRGVILPEITTPGDRFATVSRWYRKSVYVWPFFTGASE